jgi:flagellar biogenesis protein FliO
VEPFGVEVLGRLLPPLAVIIGALLLVRRWAGRQATTTSGVRVVARTGVARGAIIAVVEVGARRFLVGAGEHGVSLLGELDPDGASVDRHDPASPAAMEPAAAHLPGPRMGLVDRLRAMTVRTHLQGPLRASRG